MMLLIIIFHQIVKTLNEVDLNELNLLNPVAFNLLKGNIIVFSNKGFHTFDQDFNLLYDNSFAEEIIPDYSYLTSNLYFPSFLQIPEEEGYVIFLFLKTIYYFNYNGDFKKSFDLEDLSNINNAVVSNYDLTYYKTVDLEYYYTIIVCDLQDYYGNMYLFYYKINLNGDNTLITKNIYYNTDEPISQDCTITCQKLITNDNNKYITCFYQYSTYTNKIIKELSFEPDNNFSYINDNKYIETIDGNHMFRYAVSTANEDNSKAYVCYSSYDQYVSCFYFDINQKEFSTIYIFGEKGCKSNFYSLNLNYNNKNKEYIFSCVNSQQNGFYIIKFEENMNFIQPSINGNFSKLEDQCFVTKTGSIIYLSKYDQYKFICL